MKCSSLCYPFLLLPTSIPPCCLHYYHHHENHHLFIDSIQGLSLSNSLIVRFSTTNRTRQVKKEKRERKASKQSGNSLNSKSGSAAAITLCYSFGRGRGVGGAKRKGTCDRRALSAVSHQKKGIYIHARMQHSMPLKRGQRSRNLPCAWPSGTTLTFRKQEGRSRDLLGTLFHQGKRSLGLNGREKVGGEWCFCV